jgi:hypothetical protein
LIGDDQKVVVRRCSLDEAADDPKLGALRLRRSPRRVSVGRTVKALQKAGLGVAAIKHTPDGSVFVIPGAPEAVPSSEPNPWDAS